MWAIFFALGVTVGVGTLSGWIVHWSLHQPWMGKAYRAHLTHHKLYPGTNLVSKDYRSAQKDDGAFVFFPIITALCLPFAGLLYVLGLSGTSLFITGLLGVGIGIVHDIVHTQFHLEASPLNNFKFFQRLRELHFAHHRNAKKNLGIFYFGWDKLFKSFKG